LKAALSTVLYFQFYEVFKQKISQYRQNKHWIYFVEQKSVIYLVVTANQKCFLTLRIKKAFLVVTNDSQLSLMLNELI
jgi:hypothetical protein